MRRATSAAGAGAIPYRGRFAGRAALVTGAGSGIGAALASALVEAGAHVVCTDVDEAAGNRAYRAILAMLAAVPLLAIAFVVIYFAVPKTMYIDFGVLHANAQNVGFGLTGGLAVVLINLLSVGAFGRAEVAFSTLKVTALVAFILVALLLIVVGVPGHPATGWGHLSAHGGFLPHGLESVWLSMSIVMFAFVGVEVIPIAAAEADDPRRSVRTAMRALVGRLGLFYVVAVLLIVTLNAWTDIASAEGLTASPFVRAFDAVGLPAAAGIMNFVILVAALSTGNAQLYGAGRLVHSLAYDRLAPAFLARTTRRGAPVAATLVSALGLLLAVYLAQTGVADAFTKLVSIAIFSVLVTWLLALAAYIAFRRVGSAHGSVRLPGGVVSAAVGIVGVLAVMATAVKVPDMQRAALIGSAWVLVLLVAYGVARGLRRPRVTVS